MQGGGDPPDPVDVSPFRYLERLAPRNHDPLVCFFLPADVAPEVDAPFVDAVGLLGEAERVVRDGEFRAPPVLEDACADVPDRVPRDVVDAPVLRENPVALHPRDVGGKDKRGLPVVVGVDHDAEPVGLGAAVPPRELADDLLRMGVITDDADVQRAVVVQEPHGRDLRGERSFFGVELGEIQYGGGLLPLGVVHPPVDDGGIIDAHRSDDFRRIRAERRDRDHTCRYQQRERCSRHTWVISKDR